jgi:hypothetical protein
MYKVAWPDFLEHSNTLAFLSNQIERKTNMIKELVAFRSATVKHAVASIKVA